MTLVVGHVHGNQAGMYGDSRLSIDGRDLVRASNPLTGTLKTIIVSPRTCVGFAGRVAPAREAIRSAASDPRVDDDLEWLLNRLLAVNEQTGDAVEFLVAHFAADGGRIGTVKGKRIDTGQSKGWIGDLEAFNAFQEAYHTPPPFGSSPGMEDSGWDVEIALNVLAMERVIERSDIRGVGDMGFYVASGPRGFRYLSHAKFSSGPLSLDHPPGGGWSTLRFGATAEEGSYSPQVLTTSEAGPAPVAVYIPEAKAGSIYDSLGADETALLPAENLRSFELKVWEETGRKLTPAGASADPLASPDLSRCQPGRNDRCWCESGAKYKVCHYRFDRAGPDRAPRLW